MTETLTFRPDWVSPPGDTIADLLEERGWSQAEFAERAGCTAKHANDLVKARAPITAETAQRLAHIFGSTPRFWLVREAHYQADNRRLADRAELTKEKSWLKELPLAWMKKLGWVAARSNKGEQVAEVLRFFGVASVGAWRAFYERPLMAFRASKKHQMNVGAVAAWKRRTEQEAETRECAKYDRKGLRESLSKLRALTPESDPVVFVPELIRICAEVGVVVVFVPAPPGCPASGTTRWLSPDRALLALSLRHKSNDHLWFTVFHEAGHLLLHGKKMQFLEGIGGLDPEVEAEADRFAADTLIPTSECSALTNLNSIREVKEFAARIGIAPGIVVGRMQKAELIPWAQWNQLKVQYRWSE